MLGDGLVAASTLVEEALASFADPDVGARRMASAVFAVFSVIVAALATNLF
jgi:hypothetical protein